jgi:CelD/BcsL family acetyltransferase involved in cellulose biosynthesis
VNQPAPYLRWLTPRDARAVARVERQAYPRRARDGLREIRFDLLRAERAGASLSLGLYAGPRLVGYLLAFVLEDRRLAFEEFEVEPPRTVELQGAAIYVQDVVVLRAHARQGARLFRACADEARRRHPELPMDAFCRPAALALWRRHRKWLAGLGFELAEERTVRDLTGGEAWYWLSWRASASRRVVPVATRERSGARLDVPGLPPAYEARVVRTEAEWRQVEPDWERLVDALTQAGPFHASRLQRCWWQHFGLTRNLLIVLLYREARLVGIAPLMVVAEQHAGRHYDSLQFVGEHSLMERPDVLVDPDEAGARASLWQAVAATHGRWNAALLYEQADAAATHPLLRALPAGRLLARETQPQLAPYVALQGDWRAYLAGRSRALRKGLARKLRRLQETGDLQLQFLRDATPAEQALTRYLEVERRSWKHVAGQGIASRAGHADYYRELLRELGPRGGVQFAFLRIDGVDIAATISLLRNGRLAAVEVCHDQAFDRHSPGFVLTGLELEALHGEAGVVDFDFLSGTLENKLPWATGSRVTRDLYLLPDDLRARWALAWMFSLKPAAKRLLDRLRLRRAVFAAIDRLRARPDQGQEP